MQCLEMKQQQIGAVLFSICITVICVIIICVAIDKTFIKYINEVQNNKGINFNSKVRNKFFKVFFI